MSPEEDRVEESFASMLWVNGDRHPVRLVRVSDSHVELSNVEGVALNKGQLVALVARSFLSLPLRVEEMTGSHIRLRFVQLPHQSVIDLLRSDLPNGNDQCAELPECDKAA